MRFVIKFGGSSLSTVSKVKKIAKFISYFHKTKADELVVVVSAMGKTTDALLKMAKKALVNKQQRPAKYSTRAYTRCSICGRPHAVLRKYGICRICFRELAYKGQIPGVKKASW